MTYLSFHGFAHHLWALPYSGFSSIIQELTFRCSNIFCIGLARCGYFFFLSGFGLSASLAKDSSFKRFFRKRFVRIIPCWWIVLAGMAFFGSVVSLKGFPITAEDYFHWFSGTGWWLAGCNFEWYIPTLLVFYLLAPLLSSMSIRQLSICAVVAAIIAVALSSGIVNCFNHVYMSYSRLRCICQVSSCIRYGKVKHAYLSLMPRFGSYWRFGFRDRILCQVNRLYSRIDNSSCFRVFVNGANAFYYKFIIQIYSHQQSYGFYGSNKLRNVPPSYKQSILTLGGSEFTKWYSRMVSKVSVVRHGSDVSVGFASWYRLY